MLDFFVRAVVLTRHLEATPDDREQLLMELLFWPEISTFGTKPFSKGMQQSLYGLAEAVVRDKDAGEFHERQIPGDVELGGVMLRLYPSQPSEAWTKPVELRFPSLYWQHEKMWLAYLPQLGIEVVTDDEEKLPSMMEEHARTAVLRLGYGKSLFQLALIQRTRELTIEEVSINLYPESAKERWSRLEQEEAERKDELSKVGLAMLPENMARAVGVADAVERLEQMLTGRRAMSVLLVGPPGVGKTA
ncbi:MAG: hypothetical protein AAF357_14610, partial [Verrucomicrobiota bacterium]